MNEPTTTEAIYDLARVLVAVSGRFESKSEAVRRLHEFSIPPSRIAAILAMRLNDVTSRISQDKKRKGAANAEVDHNRV